MTFQKRIRRTWSGREIDHVWAHQRAESGRSTGKKVFFEGPTIYSYGTHFPMARLIIRRGQPVAVLITTERYSNTTSQHQSDVRSATRHLRAFHVADVKQTDHRLNLRDYRDRIRELAGRVRAAKCNTVFLVTCLDGLIKEANGYAEFFGLKTRLTYPKGFDVAAEQARGEIELEKQKVRDANREARRQERQAAKAAERDRKLAEYRAAAPALFAEYESKIQEWLDGKGKEFPDEPRPPGEPYSHAPRLVRLRVRGQRIETSQHAVVSVEAAKPLLLLVREVRTGGVSVPDLNIDGYRGGTVDYDARLVTVGCHTIAFDEIERIAKQLGL